METGMTERKPREITFASWVDQQISEATEQGAFDDLPGAGKPISRRGGTEAWLQDYLRREGVSADELLPTPLRLRKEVERLAASVQDLRSEQEVREVVKGLNRQIAEWRRLPTGPPVYVRLVDEEAMVARWREARRRPPSPTPGGRSHPDPLPRRSRWWRRRSLRAAMPGRGLQDDRLQLVVAQRDRVALHAARRRGPGRDVVGLPGAEAERGQPGHAEQADGLADPGQAVLDGRAWLPGQQLRRLGVPVQHGGAGGHGAQG